jgi:DNA-binding response OmpR family regulator
MSNGHSRNPVKVLVVDDEIGLVELIRSYLVNEGFSVLVADDGLSTLDLARTHDPDLLVLDLMLPPGCPSDALATPSRRCTSH